MFSFSGTSIKVKLATAAVVAAGAVGIAASSASAVTSPPPLQAGDTQDYASLTSGGPRITSPITRTFSGNLSLTPTAVPLTITCTGVVFTVVFNVDGTTSVTNAVFPATCPTSSSTCTAVVTATGLPWGNRLVTNGGVARDRINVGPAPGSGVVNTLSGSGCPAQGAFPFSGIISPRVVGGSGATAATRSQAVFDASAGLLSNPTIGTGAVNGTLFGTVGQPLFVRS